MTDEQKALAKSLEEKLKKDGVTQFDANTIQKLKDSMSKEQWETFARVNLGKAVWNEDYFYKTTLRQSESIQIQGSLNGWLVFMLFLSYVLTFVCTFRGLKSTGKMVYVTCLGPYVILFVFFIKGLTLEGCGSGLYYLWVPTKEKLALVGQGSTWKTAAS